MTSQKGAYILEEASAGKEQTEVVLFGYRQRSSTLTAKSERFLTAENVQARLVFHAFHNRI